MSSEPKNETVRRDARIDRARVRARFIKRRAYRRIARDLEMRTKPNIAF